MEIELELLSKRLETAQLEGLELQHLPCITLSKTAELYHDSLD